MNTVTLTVNGRETSVPAGASILEAARTLDIAIPTLCFHKELSTPACRGSLKPGARIDFSEEQIVLLGCDNYCWC